MKIMERMAAIIAGSMLVGVGINFFLIPYHLLDGGMIGIGLIFHYYIGLPTGLGVILSSIPLYIYAWYFEKKLFLNSLHGLLFSSLCIDIFSDAVTGWNIPIYVSAIIGGRVDWTWNRLDASVWDLYRRNGYVGTDPFQEERTQCRFADFFH